MYTKQDKSPKLSLIDFFDKDSITVRLWYFEILVQIKIYFPSYTGPCLPNSISRHMLTHTDTTWLRICGGEALWI